jgi:hypothetical protein
MPSQKKKRPKIKRAESRANPFQGPAPINAENLIAADAAAAKLEKIAAAAPTTPAAPEDGLASAPIPEPPAAAEEEEEAWRSYKRGEQDDEGCLIEEIFVRARSYVIYQADGLVNFQGEDDAIQRADQVADLLHMVSILRPSDRTGAMAVNQQVARAVDLCLAGRLEASKLLFQVIVQQLEQAALAGQRLFYFLAATVSAFVVWVIYLILHSGGSRPGDLMPPGWEPWFLAASLGAVGGLLSVCMRLGTIAIYPSQAWYVTLWAGVTRILIALLGGCACLLAIRSKVIMGIAAGDGASSGVPLAVAEMFFCFLAGFSETFVANIFRRGEEDAFQEASQSQKKTP